MPIHAGMSTPKYAGPEITDEPQRKRPRRTGADSADKNVRRDVQPRRDLVVFTDEPGQKKYTNRRKRTRLNKGGMFFNARDRQIVLLVAAHGWLDLNQMCALLGNGVTPGALRHSLKRLVDHGLSDNKYRGFIGQILYTVTAFGLRKVEAKGFKAGVAPHLQTVEHTDAITALHIHIRHQFDSDVVLVTERELYAAVASGELSPRILKQAPWAVGYSGFIDWLPTTYTSKGTPTKKRPDGYLLTRKDGRLMAPQAIEIERHVKSRKGYYRETLLAYADAAAKGDIAPVVTYFAPNSLIKSLEGALSTALGKTPSSSPWPPHLPRVKAEVRDLDAFYTPYSARRGWIA